MHLIRVDPTDPDPALIGRAAAALRAGGLVAFPTETVYGLGASALDERAVRRVYAAKARPPTNPLIVHVTDAAAARALAAAWPGPAEALAKAYWPGPLTLVLPRVESVPDVVTAGLDTVALRVPAHPVALALLAAAEVPVAAPSANPAGRLSPTTADHVARGLGERVDLILDGGPTDVGIESMVIDLSGPQPVLLRPGTLAPDELERRLGTCLARPTESGTGGARPSPGMLERHYAPRAKLRLFEAADPGDAVRLAAGAEPAGRVAGAMLIGAAEPPVRYPVRMSADPAGYARELYATLHMLDDAGCDLVLVERVPDSPAWTGIRDRLERAASGARREPGE